jgi:signal transduction histidine kinase
VRSSVKQTTYIFVLTLAITVLLIIAWTGWQVIQQPDIGALWTEQGDVYYAHTSSLQVGDRVLSIDGTPVSESLFPYYSWARGDLVHFEVERNSQRIGVEIPLDGRAPPFVLALRLSITIVAFAFWAAGTAIALFLPPRFGQVLLFFIWSQTMAALLAFGNTVDHAWASRLSILLTWWVIPIAIHFHLLFPFNQLTPTTKKVVGLSYVVPLLASVRLLDVSGLVQLPALFESLYASLFYVWVLVGLMTVLALLFRAYGSTSQANVKRQVGQVALSGFLSLTPLLTLSIIPQLVLGASLIPTEFNLLFLTAIPVGYSYAITRYKFVRLDRYFSRSATVMLLVGLLTSIYFIFKTGLERVFPATNSAVHLVNFITLLLVVLLHNPLYHRLKRLIDSLLYGGWYDYPSVVGRITSFLGKTTDVQVLAESISQTIQRTMRVQWACLLLPGTEKGSIVEFAGRFEDLPNRLEIDPQRMPNITGYLRSTSSSIFTHELQELLSGEPLTRTERTMLQLDAAQLWLPIRGRGNSLGVLILGPKFGGVAFDDLDMDILKVVSRQASIAFQNIQLIDELEDRVAETEQYQRRIVRTREEERTRIARELHDQVIQSLIGMNYQLANIQSSLNLSRLNPQVYNNTVELRENLGGLIRVVRAVCHNLRPSALDLGLLHSMRSAVNNFEMSTGIGTTLIVTGDRAIEVYEEAALCLYHCTNEALSNIRKHAAAEDVRVKLDILPSHVSLCIQDNGCGFQVPERLGILMEQNHFGLVGMRERLELVNGVFRIFSEPGQGTRLEVKVPLRNCQSDAASGESSNEVALQDGESTR